MKYLTGMLLILLITFTFFGCSSDDSNGNGDSGDRVIFTALVLENNQALLVEPEKDSNEYKSSDKIVVHTNEATVTSNENEEIAVSDIEPGQTVEITYNGMIAESYPAQIWADKIKVLK